MHHIAWDEVFLAAEKRILKNIGVTGGEMHSCATV